MTNEIEKRAEQLAMRLYTEVAFRDKTTTDGYIYVAITPELEGCMAQGETLREAKENLRLFRIDYILHLLENNLPVPDPAWTITQTEGDAILFKADEEQPTFEEMPEQGNQHGQREMLYKAQMIIKNDEIEFA